MKKITLKRISITFITLLFATVMFSQTVDVTATTTGEERESDGDVSLSSSDLELYRDLDSSEDQIVGIHFGSVAVPQNATITNAYIQFQADQSNSGSVIVRIEAEAIDDSPDLDTDDADNFSERTPTTNNVNWDIANWTTVGAAGANERTSDISSIVDEITSRAGWVSGNGMTFVFTGVSRASTTTIREPESGSSGGTPVLHIEYTVDPEIDITGNGVSIADGDATPDVADDTHFGSVGTGQILDKTYTITNAGGGTLNLTGASLTGDAEFSVISAPGAPVALASGNTLDFVIRFSPTATATSNGLITILSDDADESSYTFNIQGTGVTPVIEIDVTGNGVSITDGDAFPEVADDTDFASVVVATSQSKTFTIENTGTANLSVTSVVSNDANFVVTTSAPETVTIGSSTTFDVQFTPSGLGLDSATITIVNDDADENPYTFTVQGTGIAAPTYPSVIVAGDVDWNYLDDGSDQGDAGAGWTAIAFDDSLWGSGQAELGYGDSDEATELGFGGDENNKYTTTYFRKYVGITDASAFNSIDLGAIRDDAMVVYLNGEEIWRDNISADPVQYNDFADDDVNNVGNEATWIYTNVASTDLVTGINVIAVEIHQRTLDSSDISFDFEFTPSVVAPGATQIERGPYLQSGTPNSIVVKWRTDNATISTVNYGTTLGFLSSSESDASATTEHEITLTGLTANTTYYYEIEDAVGLYLQEDSEIYIKTSPDNGTQQFVRAWILGDAGTADNSQRSVRDAYKSYALNASTAPSQTDLMLFLGDNAYNDGYDNEYQDAFFDIYDETLKKAVSWSTLGNHDYYGTNGDTYYEIFTFPTDSGASGTPSGTEAYYSFDYANIHFIVLESQTLSNDSAQMAWCAADIAATNQDWIVAFFHHPPYTYSNTHNSDSEGSLVNMRNNFVPILEAGGVDLVLNGHSHLFERTFYINGHTGLSNTFDSDEIGLGGHIVGANGSGDGKIGSDGAYARASLSDTEGAVYVTTGSAGKTNPAVAHRAHHYISSSVLGSCVLEVESDGADGQNLTVKFIRETGAIDDEFTINKGGISIVANTPNESVDNNVIALYPVPTNDVLNVKIKNSEILQKVIFYNAIGSVAKVSNKEVIDVSNLKTGVYMLEITTDIKSYFKTVIIE